MRRRLLTRSGFQLPLSGSRGIFWAGLGSLGTSSFQLPLSGSPGSRHGLSFGPHSSCFQLPLSGSLGGWGRIWAPYPIWSFNSLSRDHLKVDISGLRIMIDISFNSLSRDHATAKVVVVTRYRQTRLFQLPLSGSLVKGLVSYSLDEAFNSLSRDHRARFRDFPSLRGFLPRHPFAQMISKTTIWIYRFAPL